MDSLVIGGTQYFGKKLVRLLLDNNHNITMITRGLKSNPFGKDVRHLVCDRRDEDKLRQLTKKLKFDTIFDQVCLEAGEARSAVKIFTSKTGHYIKTSTQSVYNLGANLSEEAFDPGSHKWERDASSLIDFAESNRQAEAEILRMKSVSIPRFSLVLGSDDYSGRLMFHVNRIRTKRPIHFPNLDARISLISSDDAAKVLFKLSQKDPVGPVNASSARPIYLDNFVRLIEDEVGQKLIQTSDTNHSSPIGISDDWFLNTSRLRNLGIRTTPILTWLPEAVREMLE